MMSYKVFCLLISAVCLPGFTSSTSTQGQYDVGCYTAFRKLQQEPTFMMALLAGNVPSCKEGGFWEHFHCHREGCNCTYVDTGNLFSVDLRLPSYSYSASEWSMHCPVRMERNNFDCTNPPLQYPCDMKQQRFVYNAADQACKPVTGVCHGYQTQRECETECVPVVYGRCSFPMNAGSACGGDGIGSTIALHHRHNPETGYCEPFVYYGCGGNSNNYASNWECQKFCVSPTNVLVEVRVNFAARYNVTAPTWLLVEKYHLNRNQTNEITSEVFKDIEKNAVSVRRFYEEIGAEERRQATISPSRHLSPEIYERMIFPSDVICNLPAKTGPCRAFKPRWYFDPVRSKCFKFIYGGCAANGNNFLVSIDCTNFCGATSTPSPSEEISLPRSGAGNRDPRTYGGPNRIGPGAIIHAIPTTATSETTAA